MFRFQKILANCLLLLTVSRSLYSQNNLIKAEYVNISPPSGFTEREKSGLNGFNGALRARLAKSSYYTLAVGEVDRVIHGEISRVEGIFVVNVFVTDFATQKELSAATAEFLSFSQYGFAVDMIAAQLEGREVAARSTERAIETNLKFKTPEFRIPSGDETVYRMESMLLDEIDKGNQLFSEGDYKGAQDIFSGFLTRYDTMLTKEYQDLFIPMKDYARSRWELTRAMFLFGEAGRLAMAEEFEKSLAVYEETVVFISGLASSGTEPFRELKDLAADSVHRLDPICHDLLLAREGEFVFRINYFAFQNDQKGLRQTFESFYNYASRSRYAVLVQENYNSKRAFYAGSFDMTGIPAFFVYVEGGTFTMGTDDGDSYSRPAHEVTVDSFWMSPFEITYGEYCEFCKETKRDYPAREQGQGNDYPVASVNWYDAVEYCNWRSRKEGLAPCYTIRRDIQDPTNVNGADPLRWSVVWDHSANGYRLPTEAEWEYAARGGIKKDGTLYSGSDFLDEVGWYDGTAKEAANRGGEKKPNSLLLFDMSGNLWEWCWDWFDYKYYSNTKAVNPLGAEDGSSRVVRGGGFINSSEDCRVDSRYRAEAYYTSPRLGMRIVRNGS